MSPLVVALDGQIARAELPRLSATLCAQLDERERGDVECDVSRAAPDAVTVDALARLRLVARRHNGRLRVSGASPQLLELIHFMGLAAALAE
jgi:ABC-type transporter Mla MlaB component